jgi:hypothetical protein
VKIACKATGFRAAKAARARPEMRTGEPAYSAVVSQSDPTAVLAEMKRTEALLRDARSVLRRVDALAAKASTSDDPSRTLIADLGREPRLRSPRLHRRRAEILDRRWRLARRVQVMSPLSQVDDLHRTWFSVFAAE